MGAARRSWTPPKLYTDPRLFPPRVCGKQRQPRLALPSGPGQGRPPAPSPAMSSDPALSGDTRPAGLACPPPPSSDARELLPHAAPDPRLHPGGPRPCRSACPGEEARRARRRRPEGGRALRRRRSTSFPPSFLAQAQPGRTGPLALCLLLLHGAMRLGGGSREKQARGLAVRAAGAGRGRPAGGRRRKRQGAAAAGRAGGSTRAAGGLSRAGTRVLRYPSSHQRQ